jgi:2,3,4,5-tetrahydropyridine-2-carboxylate N-succinyltransferase
MDRDASKAIIERAWEERQEISPSTGGEVRQAVQEALSALDRGELRVAEKGGNGWQVNEWAKKAVLLSFRLNDMTTIPGAAGRDACWWDKVASKFEGWDEGDFQAAGFRAVIGSVVRQP